MVIEATGAQLVEALENGVSQVGRLLVVSSSGGWVAGATAECLPCMQSQLPGKSVRCSKAIVAAVLGAVVELVGLRVWEVAMVAVNAHVEHVGRAVCTVYTQQPFILDLCSVRVTLRLCMTTATQPCTWHARTWQSAGRTACAHGLSVRHLQSAVCFTRFSSWTQHILLKE